MRILIVRLSSFGDVIHAFPAITDAKKSDPSLTVDWVVEKAFAPLVSSHPAVNRVIPIELRKWRKNWRQAIKSGELRCFIKQLREERYDVIIDVQGLVKSALVSRLAKGVRYGYDKGSAREPVSSWFYHQAFSVAKDQHAIERVRQLMAQALNYSLQDLPLDYGLNAQSQKAADQKSLIFVFGTTWESKQWPVVYWQQLIEKAVASGYQVKLPAWGAHEIHMAQALSQAVTGASAWIEPEFSAVLLGFQQASAIVSVDTGLSHLAAALAKPNIALLGPTEAKHTGAYGKKQMILAANFPCAPCKQKQCNHPDRFQPITPPCFEQLTPERVWALLSTEVAQTL